MYSMVLKNYFMFEFAAFLLPTDLGQPMHSQIAMTELPLAATFSLTLGVNCE